MYIIYVDIYIWSDPHNVQRKNQKFKGSEFIDNVDMWFLAVLRFSSPLLGLQLCHVYVRQGSSHKQILIKFLGNIEG